MKLLILAPDTNRLKALQEATAADADFEITAKVGGADQLIGLANGSVPDVLIFDAPDEHGIDSIEVLSRNSPSLHAIAISEEQSSKFLMRAMRAGVREVLPTDLANGELSQALGRVRAPAIGPVDTHKLAKVYAFMACKGGAGATFLASNLAYALAAESQQRVALIDLNLRFGDAALYVSDQPAPSNVAELCRQIHRLDGALLAGSMLEVLPNFSVLAAPEDPAHISDVQRAHVEAIIELARTRYDVVVIDTGRTFDAISLRALDFADKIFCVLQLSVPHVRNARRLLDVFQSLDYPRDKVHLLVNRYAKGGELELDDVEKTLERKVHVTIPNQFAAVTNSINLGLPLVKSQRTNPVSRALIEMGRRLVPRPRVGTTATPRWMSRVFGARA